MSRAAFVADTSVIVKSFLVGEHGQGAAVELLLRGDCHEPRLAELETSAILVREVRRRVISPDNALVHLAALPGLITLHDEIGDPLDVMRMALQLSHSPYDVVFWILALKLAVPFVTADDVFLQKLRNAGAPRAVAMTLDEACAAF